VPAIDLAFESDRLDRSLDGPVELDFDLTYVLEIDPVAANLATRSIEGKLDAVKPARTPEAGIAWALALFTAPQERAERSIEAP
jgi:hypothetical protein